MALEKLGGRHPSAILWEELRLTRHADPRCAPRVCMCVCARVRALGEEIQVDHLGQHAAPSPLPTHDALCVCVHWGERGEEVGHTSGRSYRPVRSPPLPIHPHQLIHSPSHTQL